LRFKDLSVTHGLRSGFDADQVGNPSLLRSFPLDFLGGLWHLLNFFAPAAGIGLFASAISKLLWLRELKDVSWLRLWLWSAAAAAVVGAIGLLVLGRDGKMATYGAMVLACALTLWWRAFGPGRR
jgi:hypothetical protein